ncbi:MAG: prepilin-type cleavage/methylation domain-containing protein [Gammaproteobacteria bacterium]|nr:MAG: prepilin-type cleavage/methylation domain-containing protein [Gammaproteobacteria bacterium]
MQGMRTQPASGFGLLELMIVLVVAGLLATLAIPAYNGVIHKARVERAIGDIGTIHIKIEEFQLKNNHQLPASLDDLSFDVGLDPWGQTYEFLNIEAAGPGNGGLRKDGKLNPLNTDYDLYSIGADGSTSGPLSAKSSRDDIVRANNGAFIGLGEDY